jgi:Cu/Ag efflux pump CusA
MDSTESIRSPLYERRTPPTKVQRAAHEVQRPVFFARAIVITSYLPIFTQAVEGRLFKPMAWTVGVRPLRLARIACQSYDEYLPDADALCLGRA